MQRFTVKLSKNADGSAAVLAHSLSLVFQPGAMNPSQMVAGNGDSLSDGNIQISGLQTLTLSNGETIDAAISGVNVRLADMETQLAGMKASDEKTKLKAKFDIWSAALTGIQKAVETALTADFALEKGGN